MHLRSACSFYAHNEIASAEYFACNADVSAGDGVHSQYALPETVEHAYAAHVARAVIDEPVAVFMVQQVPCECASRGGYGVDLFWRSRSE